MKIDWKHLARTKGYQSLKAAYSYDVQNSRRTKEELLRHFNWVMGRAKHYALQQARSIEDVLNEWEANRDYWWLNFYQESNQPKLVRTLKPRGIKGFRAYMKTHTFYGNAVDRKHRINNEIQLKQRQTSNKKKKRWTTSEKAHYKKYGYK